MIDRLRKSFKWRLMFTYQKWRVKKYAFFSSGVKTEGQLKKHQPVLFTGIGSFKCGKNSSIGYFPSPYFLNGYAHLDLRNNGTIEIGDNVRINNNAVLIADRATIKIGNDTLAGTGLTIYTSDFHNLNPLKRLGDNYDSKDVIIKENVFIGSNVTLLKGTIIGNNSVIANGSVVSEEIPENVIAGGVPCKVLRYLSETK